MVKISIILARHGETSANAAKLMQGGLVNLPLNDLGRRQAAALAEGMKSKKIDWIVTSKLDRAMETANYVSRYHSTVPVTRDERFNEISWGEADGKEMKIVDPIVKPVTGAWVDGDFDAKIPGGESANECKERILAAFADLLHMAREKNYEDVLVCIHGRIMRVIMSVLVDKDLSTMERFTHANCCYHHLEVELDDGTDVRPDPWTLKFKPVRIDVRDHLMTLQKPRM
ncbi:hypothetical protein LPJ57_005400 [Coemansia sp. RSA 486]|nr:hypothetical protein LPJ57_005400 [Coemansia sp. RSA 486]KAJ2700972.1 hypothetical protein FB645_004823 [Coemansia sp. IMI 203386]